MASRIPKEVRFLTFALRISLFLNLIKMPTAYVDEV